jgi:thiamine biosynthesis lipoprotein
LLAANPAPAQVSVSNEIVRAAYLMGTRATLATFGADRARGLRRLERLLEALERTDEQLSTWRADSEIGRLNAAPVGNTYALSSEVCRLFGDIEYWTLDTAHAFDPAIAQLTTAWGVHDRPRVPSARELKVALERSGWERLRFERAACLVTRTAVVGIDVGAFGKGEALDRAAVAVADDSAPWMIDLGGQVAVKGLPPGESAWQIGIAHPQMRDCTIAKVSLSSGGLSTSGGSERDGRANGHRVGHILDPRTGRPAPFEGSVVVWHESALVADVLSTALYVMGVTNGVRWAEARGLAACFLVSDSTGRAVATPTRAFVRRFGPLGQLDLGGGTTDDCRIGRRAPGRSQVTDNSAHRP